MKVPYVDLAGQYEAHRSQILSAVDRVMGSGKYILGEEVEAFERRMAEICGTRHCIAVANGTDALIMAMEACDIGPGAEVITTANSWISSASSIALVGARPVFVDVGKDQNMDPSLLEACITPKTRAIMPVHLTGKCADMDPILAIAEKYNLVVIEDAAQAVGAQYHGKCAGGLGHVACFSLHPLKNLNAMGDAGAITTNNDHLARRLRLLGNHGMITRNHHESWGRNSRLDSLQAAILNVRCDLLPDIIKSRRFNASKYRDALSGLVQCPQDALDCMDTYHLFVIQTDQRDALKKYLKSKNISTAIHYPKPIHLQACSRDLGYGEGDLPETEAQAGRILSIPVHQMLTEAQTDYVIEEIKGFFTR